MNDNRNDNIENDAIVSAETTDENVEKEQSEQEISSQGILYDYSVKHAAALAKKEKRKGVMQFIKYALCAASAGIIQIVLFTILQAVLPKDMGHSLHRGRYAARHVHCDYGCALCFDTLEFHVQPQIHFQRRRQRSACNDTRIFILRAVLSFPDLVRAHDKIFARTTYQY